MFNFRIWRLSITFYDFAAWGVMFSWGRPGGWQTVIGHWPPGRSLNEKGLRDAETGLRLHGAGHEPRRTHG